jgi:uncharacterized protein YkwD
MNRLFFPLVLVSLSLLPAGLFSEPAAEKAEVAYPPYQMAVLSEVNFARTDPAAYAQQRLAGEFRMKKDNGAYSQLLKTKALPALNLNPLLTRAADSYAKFLAEKNRMGHNERGTPFKRMEEEGYSYKAAGENIACGSFPGMNADETPEEAAVIFVKQWIVDSGVPSLGHRKNILSPLFTEIGVGFGRNPRSAYVNYTVQDFGSPR